MNKVYKSIWSPVLGEWVAVSEVAKGKGKKSKSISAAIRGMGVLALALGSVGTAFGQCADFSEEAATQENCNDVTNISMNIATGSSVTTNINGIYAITTGAGLRGTNNNTGNITKTADDDHGLSDTESGSGAITITNSGSIITSGARAKGIYADVKNGAVTITNSGNITTNALSSATGLGAYGIFVSRDLTSETSKAGGDIKIKNTGGSITTGAQHDSAAIKVALVDVVSGNVDIELSNTEIGIKSSNGDGIFVSDNRSAGSTVGASTGYINVKVVGGKILMKPVVDASIANHGIVVARTAQTAGNIYIDSSAEIISELDTGLTGDGGSGISGRITHADSTGHVTITNSGKVTIDRQNANAIHGINSGKGTVSITNSGTVTVTKDGSNGIHAQSGGAGISIVNRGDISAGGADISGIAAYMESTAAGDVSINHHAGAKITMTGNNSADVTSNHTSGIYVEKSSGATGNVVMMVDGDIETHGANRSAGVAIISLGSGDITITGNGSITTHADNTLGVGGATIASKASSGIAVSVGNAAAVSNVTIEYTGSIKTYGNEGVGIYGSLFQNKSGNVSIKNIGGTINTTGVSSHGIWARGESTDGSTLYAGNSGAITTAGSGAHGIYANNTSAQKTEVVNTGTVELIGSSAYGVLVVAGDGAVDVKNSGSITTTGTIGTMQPIRVSSTGKGAIDVLNTGNLSSNAGSSYGVSVNKSVAAAISKDSDAINITHNTGTIKTTGEDAHGLFASSNAKTGDMTIKFQGGKIELYGNNSDGLYLQEMDVGGAYATSKNMTFNLSGGEIYIKPTVNALANHGVVAVRHAETSGDINMINTGTKISILATDGLTLTGGGGMVAVINDAASTGNISIQNAGEILVESSGSSASGLRIQVNGSGTGTLTNSGSVQAIGENGFGAHVKTTTSAARVTLGSTSNLQGGFGANAAGVSIASTVGAQELTNAGKLGALNDQAIVLVSSAGNTSKVTNAVTGEMTGVFNFTGAAGDINFVNEGTVALRRYTVDAFRGARATNRVAVSDFGSGVSSFEQKAGATLKLGSTELSAGNYAPGDTTNEYLPGGRSNHSLSNAGVVQAQMLNLQEFKHQGTIDLTGNGMAGDVLIITGGATAGTYGGGKFVSNGGTVKFDTLLNQGGSISQSDVLVVDNIQQGSGAIKLNVQATVGSTGSLTDGDGIQLVEVLGAADSAVFELGAAVTAGEHEYVLVQAADGGFYLQNHTGASNKGANNNGDNLVTPYRNPNIGTYLGNQYAAAEMFNQNILDRRDNVREIDQNVWVRANHNEVKTDLIGGRQHAKIKTNLLQLGVDVYKSDDKDFVAGVYAGYGRSDVKNRSNQTQTKGDGRVTGYQVGAYASWMPQEESNSKGPYVDVWGHYGWYNNRLGGEAQQYSEKEYDSTGYSFSVEVGHGFELRRKEQNSIILEPHAQATYNSVSSDSFYDKSYTYFSGGKSEGVQTRVGARLYGYKNDESNGVQPFVEANWLHNGMSNKVRINNGPQDNNSRIGENVGEVKLGVQGNINDKVSVFSHVGGQRGSESFKRYEVQVGFNYSW